MLSIYLPILSSVSFALDNISITTTQEYTDISNIVSQIPKYYVFDMKNFCNDEYSIAEYTTQQLESYIKQVINDDAIEISVDNLEGGGDFTFMEWSADINIYKNQTLYDTVHFGWEDESYITVFALITIPSNINKTDEAYIEYAQDIIENEYSSWSLPFKIEKSEELKDKDIVLLNTEKFGTVKYKGEDILTNLYAYIPVDDLEIPEPLLLMQEKDDDSNFCIKGEIKSYYSDTDDILIQLYKEETREIFTENKVKGNNANYTIQDVQTGNYIMKFIKNNHVTREYFIIIDNKDVIQNAEICLTGDVNGDGKINNSDVLKVNLQSRGNNILDEYQLLCADVSGDGKVTNSDVIKINLYATGKTTSW